MRRPQLRQLLDLTSSAAAARLGRLSALERLQEADGPLAFFFYLLMFVSVLAILTGAAGVGLLMLIAGGAIHVARSSAEEVAARRRARVERKREVRLRTHRAARRAREAQLSSAPAAGSEEIRVTATQPRQERRASAR